MKDNKKQLLVIFIIALIVMLPMFLINGYIINDDSKFHIANVLSTIDTMNPLIPKDILPNLLGNFGVAVRQFYPIFPHTFISIFTKITALDITLTLKITHLIELFLSGFTMYFLSLRLSKNKKVALTSSIIYMLFPYHLMDIYVRDAINESFIFIFIPVIIHGLTYLFEDKKKFLLLFCFGYVLAMLSHLTMMVYFTVLLIPFFIINYKRVFKKDVIITLVEAALIILLITSPTIVNMFQNKIFGDYRVFSKGVMAQGIYHSALSSDYINYFGLLNNYSWNGFSDPNHYFYIDIVVLLMLIVLLITFIIRIIRKNKIRRDNNYLFIIIFGILSLWLSSILFPWDLLPESFRIIQFPWRMETFLSLSVAIIAPLSLKYFKKIKIDYKLIIILMAIFAFCFHTTSPKDRELYDKNNIYYELGIGWQHEYLSNKTYNNLDDIKNMDYKIKVSNGQSNIINDDFPNIKFEISEDSIVKIPRLFYFGYTLKDDKNNTYDIYDDDYGLIAANLKKGTYELKYTRTTIENIFIAISLLTIVLFIFYLYKDKLKRKDL